MSLDKPKINIDLQSRGITSKLPQIDESISRGFFITLTAIVIVSTIFPLLYLLPVSLHPQGLAQIPSNPTFSWYQTILSDSTLISSLFKSIQLGIATSLISTPLAFLGALGTRKSSRKSLIIGFFLLPIFIPGISVGLGLAIYLQFLGFGMSLWTALVGHVLWTFPFAYILILTSMSTFDIRLKEAAYDLGASRSRAFIDIELPHIKSGILGAAMFSFTLSFNEYSRTVLLRGPIDTLPTYVWGRYQTIGLDPTIYAISGLTIVSSIVLLIIVGYFVIKSS